MHFRLLTVLSLLLPLTLGIARDGSLQKRKLPPEPPATYAPYRITCPSTPLIRYANSVAPLEENYVTARKKKADKALKAWLAKGPIQFKNFTGTYPVLALTTSGGGYRSMLTGAGVHKAFDGNDDTYLTTSGLYQALTYESGLSGGSWLISSVAQDNWPTISSLVESLWGDAFQESVVEELLDYHRESALDDLDAKIAAGFNTTIVDLWARLLSYQMFKGNNGGVGQLMSGLKYKSKFVSHSVPFPIITSLGADYDGDKCVESPDAIQFEFTPFEFGSWDDGIAAFTNVQYLGTKMLGGKPVNKKNCIKGYDNQGFIMGTSSNVFAAGCSGVTALELLKIYVDGEYALYPNPFYNLDLLKPSAGIAASPTLYLTDGALSGQNIPIWPFLRRRHMNLVAQPTVSRRSPASQNLIPASYVDVLIVSDNSGDTDDEWPNGSSLYNTAQYANSGMPIPEQLSGMPPIPTPDDFIKLGLNKRPVLFGCDNPEDLLIIYLPNQNYIFESNQSLAHLGWAREDLDSMIFNGVEIANYGQKEDWAICLRCAVMLRTIGDKPPACAQCYDDLCYVPPPPPVPPVGNGTCPIGGGYCNNYSQCNPMQNCYCGFDTEGGNICFQDHYCSDGVECTSNVDCGAGWACLRADNCCGVSQCFAIDVCENPGSVNRILKAGSGKTGTSR